MLRRSAHIVSVYTISEEEAEFSTDIKGPPPTSRDLPVIFNCLLVKRTLMGISPSPPPSNVSLDFLIIIGRSTFYFEESNISEAVRKRIEMAAINLRLSRGWCPMLSCEICRINPDLCPDFNAYWDYPGLPD